jgi:hypothetical protein
MSIKHLQVRVTSTTHPEGDLQEYSNAEDAMLYAADLVDAGFSTQIEALHEGQWKPLSYTDLLALALE